MKPAKTWRNGTLVYTAGGLVVLFLWLMWGDFAYSMKDRATGTVAGLMLKRFEVSDFLYGILFTVLGSLLGWRFILGPGRMPCETFRNHMATLRPLHGKPLPSPSEEPSENDPEY